MTQDKRRPTDWRKRFREAKPEKIVVLHADFAGVKAGTTMFIGSPGVIANYMSRIPAGETRSIERMRNELARNNGAQATCPVTTAIFLRVAAEAALADLGDGTPAKDVIPFWRVISPGTKIAAKLSCGADHLEHLAALDAALMQG